MKKKENSPPRPPFPGGPMPMGEYIPIDQVRNLASQGFTEPEIATRLQSQGFSPMQIDRALRSAIREQVTGPPPRAMGPPRPMPPPREAPIREPMERPMERQMPMGYPPERIVPPTQEQPFTFEKFEEKPEKLETEITLEEVIEGVVADKWEEFEERLELFERRDVQLQAQVNDLRKKIEEIEKAQKEREQNLVGRFEDFGTSFSEIQGRIGSIEKIFKEFLPELTENVRVMSALIEKAKK